MGITSLVTGGAGFIGSHVTDHLIRLGHKVVVLDDLSGGFRENVNPSAKLHLGSVNDSTLINKLFEANHFSYVYHFAAYAAEGLSHFIRKFNYENNLIGSINLINAAVNHDVKCFVFASSIAVYGKNTLPMIESKQPLPVDPYGISKYAVEMDLQNAYDMFGLNHIIFRPHNVYGVNQNIGDIYRNVIGIFMNQILNDQPVTIFGNGEQSRAFTYIDDIAPYMADSVNNSKALNQVFNIGSDQVCSVKKLAELVGNAMGSKPKIELLDERDEVVHAYADHTKFNQVFNPKKYTNLEEGLVLMSDWVKSLNTRNSMEFENIEIRKNLPASWK